MKRLFCALFFSVLTISASAQTPSKGNNGKYGYMKNGNVVIPYIYDYASDFSEDLAKTILSEDEIIIDITLGDGDGKATAWGCDLTYDYVKINGDYRT